MGRREVEAAVESLLGAGRRFSSSELSRATGLTRQALHRHLSDWVDEGRLVREGRARATRYSRPGGPTVAGAVRAAGAPGPGLGRSYPTAGLAPRTPWRDLEIWLGVRAPGRSGAADQVLREVVTALVANAIEHSGSRLVTLRAHVTSERVALAVKDEGRGVFEHLRASLGLTDHLQALQRLSGARSSGDPAQRGGLLRASAMVRLFELDANGLEWIVDNELHDHALSQVSPSEGTEVRVDVPLRSTRTSDEMAAGLEGTLPSRLVVRLGEHAARFLSRSEARALTRGLERYREVVFDFTGVEGVGLGFVDEALRIWPREHSLTRVVTRNMNPAVEFMLRRALPCAGDDRAP